MATRTKPNSRKQPRRAQSVNAITLLREDHKRVDALFMRFGKLERDGLEKAALVQTICTEVRIHTQVEEEIFYPAVRAATGNDDLMDEADVEHDSAKMLIAQLESMQPGEDHYDAKVTVLGEYIRHHVKEEHEEMFPQARAAKVDLKALGEAISARKKELSGGAAPASDAARRATASSMPP